MSNFSSQIVHPDPQALFDQAPVFEQPLRNITVPKGKTAIFTCHLCGRPRPTIVWKGPDQEYLSNGPRFSIEYDEDGTSMLKVL